MQKIPSYQGGPYVLVLTPQGTAASKDTYLKKYKRSFERAVKGFVFTLSSGIGGASKLELPWRSRSGNSKHRSKLGLSQPLLAIQCFLPHSSSNFAVDVGITDNTQTRRRLLFSSGFNVTSKSLAKTHDENYQSPGRGKRNSNKPRNKTPQV